MIQIKQTIFISANDLTISINSSNHSVSITHKPSGLVSECQRYNYSAKNKVEAILSLRAMLSNQILEQPNKLAANN